MLQRNETRERYLSDRLNNTRVVYLSANRLTNRVSATENWPLPRRGNLSEVLHLGSARISIDFIFLDHHKNRLVALLRTSLVVRSFPALRCNIQECYHLEIMLGFRSRHHILGVLIKMI